MCSSWCGLTAPSLCASVCESSSCTQCGTAGAPPVRRSRARADTRAGVSLLRRHRGIHQLDCDQDVVRSCRCWRRVFVCVYSLLEMGCWVAPTHTVCVLTIAAHLLAMLSLAHRRQRCDPQQVQGDPAISEGYELLVYQPQVTPCSPPAVPLPRCDCPQTPSCSPSSTPSSCRYSTPRDSNAHAHLPHTLPVITTATSLSVACVRVRVPCVQRYVTENAPRLLAQLDLSTWPLSRASGTHLVDDPANARRMTLSCHRNTHGGGTGQARGRRHDRAEAGRGCGCWRRE